MESTPEGNEELVTLQASNKSLMVGQAGVKPSQLGVSDVIWERVYRVM